MRPGQGVWVLLCIALPALSSTVRAEVFLSPGLEARFGLASNRFQESDAQSSAFTSVTPTLEVSAFLPEDAELQAVFRYARRDYLRSEFGSAQDVMGRVTGTKAFGSWTGSLSLSAGTYQDQELADDDSKWLALSPAVGWIANSKLILSLSGSVTGNRYDSRETQEGESQRGIFWEARPKLLWMPDTNSQLWVEPYGELNRSNEPAEEFAGGGIAAGFDVVFFGASRAGAWARYGTRAYRETNDDAGGDRRDTPISAGAWTATRLAPWIELTANAMWEDYRSTDDAEAYKAWTVEGGVRIVYDWEATAH